MQDIVTNKSYGLESTKNVYIEPIVKDTKYISNYWTPAGNIDYLKVHAINQDGSPYVFFENRDGFIFASLEYLYKVPVEFSFRYDKYTMDVEQGRTYTNPNEDSKRILGIKIHEGYDYLKRLQNGVYGSRQISYDINRQKYSVKDYVLSQDPKITTMNPHFTFPDSVRFNESAQMSYVKNNYNFNEYKDNTNQGTIQKRKAVMNMSDSNKIHITVPGRCDYTVGMKVNATLPKIFPIERSETEVIDERFSGDYIIGSIHHFINRESHESHIELISDSMNLNANI